MVYRLIVGTERHDANQPVGGVFSDWNGVRVAGAPKVDGDRLADDGGHRGTTPLGCVLQIPVDSFRESKIGRDIAWHVWGSYRDITVS